MCCGRLICVAQEKQCTGHSTFIPWCTSIAPPWERYRWLIGISIGEGDVVVALSLARFRLAHFAIGNCAILGLKSVSVFSDEITVTCELATRGYCKASSGFYQPCVTCINGCAEPAIRDATTCCRSLQISRWGNQTRLLWLTLLKEGAVSRSLERKHMRGWTMG
jgi:hypothetical protein